MTVRPHAFGNTLPAEGAKLLASLEALIEEDRRRLSRARRFELGRWRRVNAIKLDSSGAATCLRAYDDVVVTVDSQQVGHVGSTVKRCGSIAACPHCSPVIRERRAADIDAACAEWVRQGGSVWFATFTIPHCASDSLRTLTDRLQRLYTWAWSGRAGVALRKALGVRGTIRAWDYTWSEQNGHHPHFHTLFFVEGGRWFDPAGLAARWRDAFDHGGFGDRFVPHVSIDVRPVTVRDGDGATSYLAKVTEGWGAGLELARADLKGGGSVTFPQLLELASTGEARFVRLWVEYEAAFRGRQIILWSRGLRDLVGLGDDVTDEEAAQGPAPVEVVRTYTVEGEAWNRWWAAGRLADMLDRLETGRGVVGARLWDDPVAATGEAPSGTG